MTADDARTFPQVAARHADSGHGAENAEERGEGICRTCLSPIWNEGGTVRRRKCAEGWSDRIERGGDSLVCFKAVGYRHVPLTGREAAIYDRAHTRGRAEEAARRELLRDRIEATLNVHVGPKSPPRVRELAAYVRVVLKLADQ